MKEAIGYTDKNGKSIVIGDVIDLHQTVNGCSEFVVVKTDTGWTLAYYSEGAVGRLYEYSVLDALRPCVYSDEVDYEVVHHIASWEKTIYPVEHVMNETTSTECVDNIDDWCQKYPCTSYNRKDGKAVAFKRVEDVK